MASFGRVPSQEEGGERDIKSKRRVVLSMQLVMEKGKPTLSGSTTHPRDKKPFSISKHRPLPKVYLPKAFQVQLAISPKEIFFFFFFFFLSFVRSFIEQISFSI